MRFTQFLLPDGRTRPMTINRFPEVESLASRVVDAGGILESEVLTTGEVSLTCERDVNGERETLAIEIVKNGPGVLGGVDRLVATAAVKLGL